jgi:hypothetical protein
MAGQPPPGVPPPVDAVHTNGSSHLLLHCHDGSIVERGGNTASSNIILDDGRGDIAASQRVRLGAAHETPKGGPTEVADIIDGVLVFANERA